MSRRDKRERTSLARLRSFRQHTEVMNQIFRDLWPILAVTFSILGATLHQLVRLLAR